MYLCMYSMQAGYFCYYTATTQLEWKRPALPRKTLYDKVKGKMLPAFGLVKDHSTLLTSYTFEVWQILHSLWSIAFWVHASMFSSDRIRFVSYISEQSWALWSLPLILFSSFTIWMKFRHFEYHYFIKTNDFFTLWCFFVSVMILWHFLTVV